MKVMRNSATKSKPVKDQLLVHVRCEKVITREDSARHCIRRRAMSMKIRNPRKRRTTITPAAHKIGEVAGGKPPLHSFKLRSRNPGSF